MNQDNNGSFTIPQIRELLGVNKTTSYQISKTPELHRRQIAGSYRILRSDFWKWYNSQNRYRIREDEFHPDDYFRSADISKMLGCTVNSASTLIKRLGIRSEISTTMVLVRKEAFIDWYIHQFRYTSDDPRLPPKVVTSTYSLKDIKRILNISANSTIYHLYHRGLFDLIRIGNETRVVKDSFDLWYSSLDKTMYPGRNNDGIDN